MIGKALKGIKRPAPRVPAKPAPSVVPNQGYGKVAPIGAPQTIPAMGKGLAGLSPALLSSLAGKAKLKKGGVVKKTAAKKGKK